MSASQSGNPPRRPGGIVRVEIHPGADRPIHIECHDHPHTYEVAWRDSADGPVVTDLRVTSSDDVPITLGSLRRIKPDRLARAAASRADELASIESMREGMQAELAAKFGDEMDSRGIDVNEAIGEISHWEEPGSIRRVRRKRTIGRPKLTHQELEQVAIWAREAAREAADDGLAVYPKIAQRASDSGWRPAADYDLTDNTIKGWIQRCKDAGVLKRDFTREPRKATGQDA